MSFDINNELANRRVGWTNRAREERSLATMIRAEPKAPNVPGYDQANALKARQHDNEAARLDRKAEAAARGLYYEDPDNVAGVMNKDDARQRNECLAAGRAVYEWPLTDGRDVTVAARLQGGVPPIPDLPEYTTRQITAEPADR